MNTPPIKVTFPYYRKKTDHLNTDHFVQVIDENTSVLIAVPVNLQNIYMKTKIFQKPIEHCEQRHAWSACKDGWEECASEKFFNVKNAINTQVSSRLSK